MAVDVEEADCGVNNQAFWQEMADPVLEMNNVLACYVVNDHGSLSGIHVRGIECLKKGPINIFLLFPMKKIGDTVRGETPVAGTGNCHYPVRSQAFESNIAISIARK